MNLELNDMRNQTAQNAFQLLCKRNKDNSFVQTLRQTRESVYILSGVLCSAIVNRHPMLPEEDLVIIPILRAGDFMLKPFLQILNAKVNFVRCKRDLEAKAKVLYYDEMRAKKALIIDFCAATGGSLIKTIKICSTSLGISPYSKNIIVGCCVTSGEAEKLLIKMYPQVAFYSLFGNYKLDNHKYLVDHSGIGLIGDIGDRLCGG